ncbi:MAG: hypothetical protein BV457_08260 [Thermoplasmata archaeon M9B1D]|nr:MAG: hypothetical protein BV457_08260 [Thermoplasmata archaeon M9B1D]
MTNNLGVSYKDIINIDSKIGVEYVMLAGLPGFGKSSQINLFLIEFLRRGHLVVMPGDRFCEWRHFFRYPQSVKKITIIMPENEKIYFEPPNLLAMLKERFIVPVEIKYINYRKFNILEHIPKKAESEIFVIYDQHYRTMMLENDEIVDYLWKRTALWAKINMQLVDRTFHLDKAIITPFHEGAVYFDQGAADKQWHAIRAYAKSLVDNRKGMVLPMYATQNESDMEQIITNKCIWKIYRKGGAKKTVDWRLRKKIPFTKRNEYQIMYGGVYIPYNEIDEFDEIQEIWKMIPIGIPNEILAILQEEQEKKQEDWEEKQKIRHQLKIEEINIKYDRIEQLREKNVMLDIEKDQSRHQHIMQRKAKDKEILEEKERKRKEREQKRFDKFNTHVVKFMEILQVDPDVTTASLMQEIHITNYTTAKTIRIEAEKRLQQQQNTSLKENSQGKSVP